MDVEEFKQKYEGLKDNPMYKNFCSILDTKNQVLERTAKKNQELKKQLEYLHGEEYLNQLRFERNMLQDVVDKMEVSKEDKKFIDMTHRNTQLLEENRKYKEVIDKLNKLEDIRLLTMYFEDGGEMSVLPYEDILDILKEVE